VIIIIVLVVIIAVIILCYSVAENDTEVESKTDGTARYPGGRFEGTIPCYLCLNKVRNSEWDSGDHRKRCAFKHQRELLNFPQPYNSYCPNCREKLRLWPAKGHPFYCDECPVSERTVLKRSSGHNRLNCFLCDFDRCASCATAGIQDTAVPYNTDISNTEQNKIGSEHGTSLQSDSALPTFPHLESAVRFECAPPYEEQGRPYPSALPYNPQPVMDIQVNQASGLLTADGGGENCLATPFLLPSQEYPPPYEGPSSSHAITPSLPYAVRPYPQHNSSEIPTAPPFMKH
jgi:hypothetical protein